MTKSKEFIKELREHMEPKDQAHVPSGTTAKSLIFDCVNDKMPTHDEIIDCVKNGSRMLIVSEVNSMGNITTAVSPVTSCEILSHVEYGISIIACYFVGTTHKQRQLTTLNESEYQDVLSALYE